MLLDATWESVPGVAMLGVPGAGGYDAIFAITLDQRCVKQLDSFWSDSCPSII